MLKRAPRFLIFILTVFLSLFVFCFNAKALDDFKISDFNFDKSGNVLIAVGKNTKAEIQYTKLIQTTPPKMIIDIQDSIFVGGKKDFIINKSGIENIQVSQLSINPFVVRLILSAQSEKDFSNIDIVKSKNSLLLKFGDIKEKIAKNVQLYSDNIEKYDILDNALAEKQPQTAKTQELGDISIQGASAKIQTSFDRIDNDVNIVLTNIRSINNHVIVSGVGGISFKEPFILTYPTRVVFDIPNSVVENYSVLKNSVLSNGDKVRTGQFDENTSRIVIETNYPDKYRVIFSPDAQTIAITYDNDTSLTELADYNTVSALGNIYVSKKDSLNTSLKMAFINPIIHSIKRTNTGLYVEVINGKLPSPYKTANLPVTAQFSKIQVKAHPLFLNGSIYFIPLNKDIKLETNLSRDGKELLINLKGNKNIVKVAQHRFSNKKVVIDAGHGGNDPGAIQCGFLEKDMTLDIAKRVEKYLNAVGVRVIMTRNSDKFISLKDRTVITNAEMPDIFVSIHVNATVNTRIKGVETHWYNENSLPLAKVLHQNFATGLSTSDRGIIKSMFYVINHTTVPAVLMEIGFLTNDNERCAMLTEKRKDSTAKTIANAILAYFAQEGK